MSVNAQNVKSGSDVDLAEYGAWVISDVSGLRQRLLQVQQLGPVVAVFHDLHSKGKFNQLSEQLAASKPRLLWVRLSGPSCGSGNKRDENRAAFLVRLVLQQMASHRMVIVEGNLRSGGWNLRPFRELRELGMHETLHVWCRYQPVEENACSATTRIWSNAELTSCAECQCRTGRKHVSVKSLPNASDVEAVVLTHIIRDVAQHINNAFDKQPESKPLTNEDGVNPTRISALLSGLPVSTTKSSKDVRTSNSAVTHNTISITDKTLSTSTVESSNPKSTTFRTSVRAIANQSNVPQSNVNPNMSNMPTSSRSVSFQGADEPSSSDAVLSYPTEQATRQKERKKAGIEVKKRKQHVEQHFDDVGDDLSSLQVEQHEVEHFTRKLQQEHNLASWEHAVFAFAFQSCDDPDAIPNADNLPDMSRRIEAFLTDNPKHIHVCELFGGEGLTSTLCSKLYGLNSGFNFELKNGVDLNTDVGRQDLFAYLNKFKPDVVVMAPPCKGFGPWIHLNRIINAEAVRAARRDGVPLATLCAEVAEFQLSCGNHFIIEQPRTSLMFQLPSWKELAKIAHVAVCDQCRFGLKNPDGTHLKKPTKFIASSPILLAHVANRFCLDNHEHGKVKSSAENWPISLCRSLARGIADLLCSSFDSSQATLQFPTFTCPGCRGHVRRDDTRHTRDENCRFKDEPAMEWTCDGCRRNRHRSDPSHTLGPDCRWAIARTRDDGGPRARRGRHPRDGSVPAARDPTAAVRLREEAAPAEGAVGHDSIEPEVLTPAEASARRRMKASAEVQAGSDPDLVERAAQPLAIEDGGPVAPNAADAEAIQPVLEEPVWSRFDLGTSLQLLRSSRPGVVRRALRKLHIRWYHAPARRMSTLLTAAGVPVEVVAQVADVVATCDICRNWSRPGNRSVTSTRLPERFNLEVELDLLFVGTHVILHMIDRCIRWSVGVEIPDRTTPSILNGIRDGWINQYGSPAELISDQEGGLNEVAAAVLEQLKIKLHLKAKSQHAPVVERHNEILRRQIHLMDQQATRDGLRVSFTQVLNEAVFSKNVLLQYGGYSPYEALFGRTPPMLDVMTAEDDQEREHPARLRSIAVQAMIQASAEDRIRRANATKSRPAGELKDMQVGDLVDIYRPTISKDVPRWHGPASITDLTALTDGIIGVRWQGRNLQVRVQDARRALAFAYAPAFFGGANSPIEVLKVAAESFKGCMRVGWFRKNDRWLSCEGNKEYPEVLHAGLHVGAVNLQLIGVFSVRFGHGMKTISGLYCDETLVCWWKPGEFHNWCHAFTDGSKTINLHNLGGSENVAFIQFLMEDGVAISHLRKINSDIANIGGVCEPRMPLIREVPLFNPKTNRPKFKSLTDKPEVDNPNEQQPDVNVSSTQNEPSTNPDVVPTSQSLDGSEIDLLPDEGENADPDIHVGWTCAASPPIWPCCNHHNEEIFAYADDDQPAELGLDRKVSQYLVTPSVALDEAGLDYPVFQYHSNPNNVSPNVPVIERTHNVLTRSEALENVEACRAAMLKELNRWVKHNAWRRMPLSNSRNLLKSKWVLKWKNIAGKKGVKGRLVAQGFQDRQSLSTFAGTTSRWGQRIVLAISTQFGWPLISADVSEAFLRGITFQELAQMDTSQPLRVVEIALPVGSEELLRTFPGMENYDPTSECLSLLKPGFGLKDAPRL